jgi:squalene-hopene/tetraprenyl-beta-curcumene cyclase
MSPSLPIADRILAACDTALRRGVAYLAGRQNPAGYWWADLTADTTLESDYILLQLWLHPPRNGKWEPPNRDQIDRAVASILERQLPDGGFNIYPGGPTEISATVKAYFALKLAGLDVQDPRLQAARRCILERGGIEAANSYTKINLSFFGLYPRSACPSIPPELILLPLNFIYQMSSWTRAIVIPLAIVHASNPQRPVPDGFDLRELFLRFPPRGVKCYVDKPGWKQLFLTLDRLAKYWERFGSTSIRQKAIRACERWMLERTRYSDGLGAIYPPMMYLIMALDVLGYAPNHPDRVEAERQFNNLMVDDGERFFFQPCFSVVWDTAIAAFALGRAGLAEHAVLQRAEQWLLSKEVRRKGDWSIKRPETEPSGWYFEFANEFYPDIDDTAMVLLALSETHSGSPAWQAARHRAVKWLVDMQSSDGGWAAFDVDNNWEPLSYVPFADHNAMLDPTCPDITGRVLEALASCGVPNHARAVRRGVEYLKRVQEADGSWYGRWGVDYIYGTFLALRGLRASGVDDREAFILRAGEWLRSIQNADGGWGESCESYEKNTFVPAPSTPSQTAWAVLGLLASGDTNSISLQRGIEYLTATQRPDGGWDEELATGTGFPRVFYLTYHMYRDAFPVLALAEYRRTRV